MKPVKFDIQGVECIVGEIIVVLGAPEPILRLVVMPNGRYKLMISKELLPSNPKEMNASTTK